jgi:hypothetical protein
MARFRLLDILEPRLGIVEPRLMRSAPRYFSVSLYEQCLLIVRDSERSSCPCLRLGAEFLAYFGESEGEFIR